MVPTWSLSPAVDLSQRSSSPRGCTSLDQWMVFFCDGNCLRPSRLQLSAAGMFCPYFWQYIFLFRKFTFFFFFFARFVCTSPQEALLEHTSSWYGRRNDLRNSHLRKKNVCRVFPGILAKVIWKTWKYVIGNDNSLIVAASAAASKKTYFASFCKIKKDGSKRK